MRKNSFIYFILITVTAILVSCNTPRHYHRSMVSSDKLFGDTLITDSTSLANKPWKELFSENNLQKLIQEGLNNNADLKVAIQKVAEAEANFSQSKASLLPAITATAQRSYTRNPESLYPTGPKEVNYYQLAAGASWEVDFWGKLRSSKRSAYATFLATDAAKKAVQTRLIANIATGYYTLLGLDAQLEITRQTTKNNIDLVETMKVLQKSGKVTGAAVVQSEATRYAAEVTIPDLEQQIRVAENTLCLLLGRTPGHIERSKIDEQKLSPLLSTGVPAQMLDNRPDVMQAEFAVISAWETTNSARAYFFPAFTLTASVGFTPTEFNKFFDPVSFASNVVGGLAQPLFNKRANATRLKVARAQQEEALITFRNTLLSAGEEVHNALGSYDSSVRKTALRQQQLSALVKSVDYTKELLNYGTATYTEVLTAQTSLLSAQLSSVNDKLQQLNAVVTLYRALGGGWK
jgi:outer membrane protein, multidrug efflux system